MTKAETAKLEFMQVVNLTADECLNLSDRIAGYQKIQPGLTKLCHFDATMQVRRLINAPARGWRETELRWAKQVQDEISVLSQDPSLEATLALACLGVKRADLDSALEVLGKAEPVDTGKPEQVEQTEKAPAVDPEPPKKSVKVKRTSAKLESLEDPELADLDEETKHALDELKSQVAELR